MAETLEQLARRFDGWVLLTEMDEVICHAGGHRAPAPEVVHAVLHRTTTDLQRVVQDAHLVAKGITVGQLDKQPFTRMDLGKGLRLWVFGATVPKAALRAAAEGCHQALSQQGSPPVLDEDLRARLIVEPSPELAPLPPGLLLVVSGGGGLRSIALTICTVVGAHARVHEDEASGRVLAVLPVTAEPLLARLAKLDLTVGLAEVPEGAVSLWRAVTAAAAAHDLAKGQGEWIADVRDVNTAVALVVQGARGAARTLCPDLVERSPALESLGVWARHGGCFSSAAAELEVHSNTLRYRVRTTAEKHGLNLEDPTHLMLQLLVPNQRVA